MKEINVLIFPAGEINSIELHSALSTCVNINVFGASSIDRHGGYVFKNYISNLPFISSCNFLETFNRLIEEYKIDIVFPTHDDVATFFADHRDVINTLILVSDKKTASICRNKEKTYQVFSDVEFIPRTYSKISEFPVFIKPKIGQGAVGTKLIQTKNDIPLDINLNDFVITEYLSGQEFTVDCLTDKQGKLRYVSPRSRDRIFAGVSVAGKTENITDEIYHIAKIINRRLSFLGLWYFQLKKDNSGKFKLLEISTRCAGSMCLTRVRGVNLPLLSVYIALGYNVDIIENPYKVTMERTLISRYKINYEYDIVYFDFDDTLVIRNNVNLNAIRFLYQCKNEGKRVILLTKHSNELDISMEKYSIPKTLFTSIVHLSERDKKIDYVNPDRAIFIDNSFSERFEINKKYNIPVFDIDALEVLLDWRI
jgi:hypothetical protein